MPALSTELRNYEAFDWLDVERWTEDRIITEWGYCKVCDKTVVFKDRAKHARVHKKEWSAYKNKRKSDVQQTNVKKAQAARRLKRESEDEGDA